jgi:hypothetical protein
MSARLLAFGGSEHREAERLLPWFVNRRLDAEEHAKVGRHVQSCAECRIALAELRALQRQSVADEETSDPTAAFAALRNRIQASEARSPRVSANMRWIAPAWVQGALAASVVCLLAVGVVAYAPTRSSQYRTLSDGSFTVADTPRSTHLVVVFSASFRQGKMEALLTSNKAQIVSGPTDAGAYVIAVPADQAPSLRSALHAARGVTFVQQLDAQ